MRRGFAAALGSGGARGWCHIGVLRALEARGHVPGGVAGCSMGALVGAAWAADRLDALEEWARDLTLSGLVGRIDPWLGQGGVIGGRAVGRLLDDLGLPERIEDLLRPLIIIATDMATGREVWFTDGALRDAVRASISIPGVFRPHQIDGRWLLDGGLVNPVPVSAARGLGFRRILGVNPNGKGGAPLWSPGTEGTLWDKLGGTELMQRLPPALRDLIEDERDRTPTGPDMMQVVSTSIDIMTEYLRATRAAADPADVTLNALLAGISVLELDRAAEAIAEGERLVQEAADRLDTVLGAPDRGPHPPST
ncbi:MAG: patatin-like phospholipase family protein [Pseudomonadota bacterium]